MHAEFVYKNDSVIKVSKVGYYHCNETAGIGTGPGPRDGKTLFPKRSFLPAQVGPPTL